ncbi:uncharacterized oxidoreductase YoxD-like [Ochlerotatus camptorhynchus]|uniref:uncharacterized oxidoreductase YoxD-like n=1 Tax=Ochlerotatus camptorhynchus TaxID=644619 RepID=UPI0031DA38F1
MSTVSEAYFKHEDGAYIAADGSDRVAFSWIMLICRVVVQVTLNIPNFAKDFIKSYIWAPKKSVRGCVTVVSGGGNGLGRALCLRLAQEGCKVAVADIDLNSAIRTAEDIRQTGMQAEAFKVDVSDLQSVKRLRKDVEARLGPVEILINNAGLLAVSHMSEGSAEDVHRILNVNLASHFWMIREFKPEMLQRNGGHIVGISSVLGYIPNYRTIAYSATKFGIRGMMESLGDELYISGNSEKVITTCVYPSLLATRKDFIKMVNDIGIMQESMSPEQAAEIVVDGVLRNRSEIILTSLPLRILIKMHVFCPARMRRIFSKCICSNTNK